MVVFQLSRVKRIPIVPMPRGDPQAVSLQGLRVARYTDNGILAATPDTVAAVHRAATALTEAGALVHDDRPAGLERAAALYNTLSEGDGRAWVRRLLQQAGTTAIHPRLQQRLEDATPLRVDDFTAVLEEVDRCRSTMLTFLQSYDLILCSVCAFPAPSHGTTTLSVVSYTEVYNLTGWPGVVVRGGTSAEGLPIGVQIVARPWREDVALAVAHYLEAALGGWQRPPL